MSTTMVKLLQRLRDLRELKVNLESLHQELEQQLETSSVGEAVMSSPYTRGGGSVSTSVASPSSHQAALTSPNYHNSTHSPQHSTKGSSSTFTPTRKNTTARRPSSFRLVPLENPPIVSSASQASPLGSAGVVPSPGGGGGGGQQATGKHQTPHRVAPIAHVTSPSSSKVQHQSFSSPLDGGPPRRLSSSVKFVLPLSPAESSDEK